ncbi:hypothetical protein C1646_768844 [Rhizophagus diaphanus]|nr:hypothetical protein C1646_768844 [Rhizophagus diaphanus] [Rhizophagus sp. MUCL 43196]
MTCFNWNAYKILFHNILKNYYSFQTDTEDEYIKAVNAIEMIREIRIITVKIGHLNSLTRNVISEEGKKRIGKSANSLLKALSLSKIESLKLAKENGARGISELCMLMKKVLSDNEQNDDQEEFLEIVNNINDYDDTMYIGDDFGYVFNWTVCKDSTNPLYKNDDEIFMIVPFLATQVVGRAGDSSVNCFVSGGVFNGK